MCLRNINYWDFVDWTLMGRTCGRSGHASRRGLVVLSATAPGGLPPADNRAVSLEPNPLPAFNLSNPVPQTGCMMDNQGSTVRW